MQLDYHKVLERCCQIGLLASLVWSGYWSARVARSVGVPPTAEFMRMDYSWEINAITKVLNWGLPAAVLTSGILGWLSFRRRALHWFAAAVVSAALIGTFASTLAVWNCLVEIHGKNSHLWSQIWWSFS